jgi:hypothetical protein
MRMDSLTYIRVYVDAFLTVSAVREEFAFLSRMEKWTLILLGTVRKVLALCFLLLIFAWLRLKLNLWLSCRLYSDVVLMRTKINYTSFFDLF